MERSRILIVCLPFVAFLSFSHCTLPTQEMKTGGISQESIKVTQTDETKKIDQEKLKEEHADLLQEFANPAAVVTVLLSEQDIVGYGVLIRSDGYILTPDYFQPFCEEPVVKVLLSTTGVPVNAKIIGRDSRSGLAVLKIDADGLPYWRLKASEDLRAGDVLLMVEPNGPVEFVTIVQFKDILFGQDSFQIAGSFDKRTFLRGVLVNLKSELVGLNLSLPDAQSEKAVLFSLSTSYAQYVADRLIKFGKINRPMFGVAIQELTPKLREAFFIKEEDKGGVLVSIVHRHTPAARAGLQVGDAIMEWDGKPIKSVLMFRRMLALAELGTTVRLKVIRQGETKRIAISLTDLHLSLSPQPCR
ncbi:MAG: PDZ domain-containing protein [Nitrospirales bacterium]|nr:PDZ domain-containing protein [Nitrospirales bacterium]